MAREKTSIRRVGELMVVAAILAAIALALLELASNVRAGLVDLGIAAVAPGRKRAPSSPVPDSSRVHFFVERGPPL